MILPAKNIGIIDVHNCLGDASYDLGTLCKSTNINHWSKWKPINYNGTTIDEVILKGRNYGINLTQSNEITVLINRIDSSGTYTYNKPTGGSASPFRLGDFRNYDHNAPLPAHPMSNKMINNGGTAVTGLAGITSIGTTTAIGYNDIYPAGLKRGIYMKNSKGEIAWCTDKIEWSKINNINNWKGDVTAYDFYTNVSKTINGIHTGNASDFFYAVTSTNDNPNPYTLTLTGDKPAGSEKYFFSLNCKKVQGTTNRVHYNVTISSIGDVYRGGTANNIAIQIHKTAESTSQMVASATIASSYTIGAETSYSWEGNITVNVASTAGLRCFLYADGQIQARTGILQEQ